MLVHWNESIQSHSLTYIRITFLLFLVLGPAVTLFHFLTLPPSFDQKIVDATFSGDLKVEFYHDVKRPLDYRAFLPRSYYGSLKKSSYLSHLIFLTHHEYVLSLQDLGMTSAHLKIISLVHEEEHVLTVPVVTFLLIAYLQSFFLHPTC